MTAPITTGRILRFACPLLALMIAASAAWADQTWWQAYEAAVGETGMELRGDGVTALASHVQSAPAKPVLPLTITGGERVIVPHDPGLNLPGPLTVEVWCKPDVLEGYALLKKYAFGFYTNYTIISPLSYDIWSENLVCFDSNDKGDVLDTQSAIRSDAYKLGRTRVEYDNGLVVWVNHGQAPWTVPGPPELMVLPENGYLAHLPGQVTAWSALMDGHRADFVQTPDRIYADGRGTLTNFGPISAKNAYAIPKDATGAWLTPAPYKEEETVAVGPNSLGVAAPITVNITAKEFKHPSMGRELD